MGRLEIAEALRDLGYETHTLWEVYGRKVEQSLDDEVWIRDSAGAGSKRCGTFRESHS